MQQKLELKSMLDLSLMRSSIKSCFDLRMLVNNLSHVACKPYLAEESVVVNDAEADKR